MEGSQDKIRSLWVPLRKLNLLLPNVAVAEIGSYRTPKATPDMPEWYLGTVRWQDQDIPVMSLESLVGINVPSNPVFSRLMILNSVHPGSAVRNYAIITAGLPGLIHFANDTASEFHPLDEPGLKCIVRIGNEEAVIPDLEYLQSLLEEQVARAA
ncbi:MAG: chemotaxis protein CheW [Gammaproteobacteria bacterium]